jgi:hypothetical protein
VSWRALIALVVLVGAANLVVLLAQAPALVHSLYTNADNASGLVLPALATHAPAGSVIDLGNHAWYEAWWFMRATAGLGGYRSLWEAAPIIAGLLGTAVVTACAWSAVGRLAGLLCAVVLLAASEALRGVLYVPESHGSVILHAGVLCGALLISYRILDGDRRAPPAIALIGVPLVLFTGAGLTDQLLFVSALGPFILAPVLCWLRFRSRVWLRLSSFALTTGVLSALLALLLTHVMQNRHVIHAPFPVSFVAVGAMFTALQNLAGEFLSLGGGDFFGAPVSGVNLLTFIAGALVLLALAGIARLLWRWIATMDSSVQPHSARAGSRELFTAYWGLVLVFVFAAFALTSLSGTPSDSRYLIGAWAAVAALLGVLAASRLTQTILMLAVALFGVLNLRAELASGVAPAGVGPDQRVAGAIEHFASANGAIVGYSGYWDAAPVTWESRLRVQVYPINGCALPKGVCAFNGAQISSWYAPRARTRTFLLTDTRPGIPLAVTAPPASFGQPLAHQLVGEGLTVYIYNHDLAADLSP